MSFTPIPDTVLDYIIGDLTGAEVKTVLYLAWKRYRMTNRQEQLTAADIGDATGYTVSTIKRALRSLEERGVVQRHQRHTLEDGDLPTLYSLTESL